MDKTFVKGLKLLEVLARSEQPRGVTSLALEMGLSKSNVHRLLTTSLACGFVRRWDDPARYELTYKIWELGVIVRSRLSLTKLSSGSMEKLGHLTNESVHLSVLDGLEVLYIDKVESKQPILAYTRIGARVPAYCVATGKAMLAFTLHNEDEIVRYLQKYPCKLRAYTPQTITNAEALQKEFATARSRGYAINRGEWREGVYGIGAPIWDAAGQVVGGIGISGPAGRFCPTQMKSWSNLVIDAAAEISQMLGPYNKPELDG